MSSICDRTAARDVPDFTYLKGGKESETTEPAASVLPATVAAATVAAATVAAASTTTTAVTSDDGTKSSLCKYVCFEAEGFHMENLKNQIKVGDPGLRTLEEFRSRFVFNDEDLMKAVMCKYWGVSKITGLPISKRSDDGLRLDANNYRVPCNKNDINLLITAFKRYKAFLESTTNKGYLNDIHFNTTAQIGYVEIYLQRLAAGLQDEPADCIGDHETTKAKKYSGLDNYYEVLPKVFYLLYRHSKSYPNEPLKAKEVLDKFSDLVSNDPDDLLKSISEDTEVHSKGFEPVPVSVLALMNLITEKFPHLYKMKVPDIGSGSDSGSDSGSEMVTNPQDVINELDTILGRIFDTHLDDKQKALDKFVEAHTKYGQKDSEGALKSIHDSLDIILSIINTQETSSSGSAAKPLQQVQALPSDKEDKEDPEVARLKEENEKLKAEKEAEIQKLKDDLAKCAEKDSDIAKLTGERDGYTEKSKACEENVARLTKEVADLTAERDRLQAELTACKEKAPDSSEADELQGQVSDVNAKLTKVQSELDSEKAASKKCSDDLAASEAALASEREARAKEKAEYDGRLAALQTELDKCNQDKTSKDETIKELNIRREVIEKELVVLRSKVVQSEHDQSRIAELEQALAKLQAEYNDCTKENATLKQRLAQKDNEIQTLNTAKETVESQLKVLQAGATQNEADKKLIAELQQQIQDLNARLAACEAEKGQLKMQLEERIHELTTKISALEASLAAATALNRERTVIIDQLRRELTEVISQKEMIETRHTTDQAEKDQLEKKIGELNQKIAELTAALAAASVTGKEKDTQIESLRKLLAEATSAKDTLETQYKNELSKRDSDITILKSKISQLITRITTLEKEIQERDIHIREIETHVQSLQAELTKAITEKESGSMTDKTVISKLEKQLADLRDQLKKANKDKADFTSQLDKLRELHAADEKRISELEAEIERLHTEYITLNTEAGNHIKDLEEQLESVNGSSEEEITRLKGELAKLKSELDSSKQNTRTLDGELHKQKGINQKLQEEIQRQKADYEKRNKELAALVSDLEGKLKDAKVSLENLRTTGSQGEEALNNKIRSLEAKIAALQKDSATMAQSSKDCDKRIEELEARHREDIKVAVDAIKGVMMTMVSPLTNMNPDLGNTGDVISSIQAVGGVTNLPGLQDRMKGAIGKLNAYLSDVNSNYNSWKAEFEKKPEVPRAIPPTYVPEVPRVQELQRPVYNPAPLAPRATGDNPTAMITNRGFYILYISDPKSKVKAKGTVIISTEVQGRAASSTEANIYKALDSMQDCFKSPVKCRAIENLVANIYDVNYLKKFWSGLKTRGYIVDVDGPYPTKEVARSRAVQQGGKRDVQYGKDSLKSLIKHQELWEELKDSYESLPAEYKKVVPEPGSAPVTHTLEPFTRYVDEQSEDPESIKEAREAVEMLAPDDLDTIMDSDNESPAMSRIKPHYQKALPKVNEEWLPVMIRADIVSKVLDEKLLATL